MDSGAFLTGVKKEMEEQHALENAKILIQKMNEVCFERCVVKVGTSLSSSEQTCTNQCIGKYLKAWNQVSIAYIGRVKKEQEQRTSPFSA